MPSSLCSEGWNVHICKVRFFHNGDILHSAHMPSLTAFRSQRELRNHLNHWLIISNNDTHPSQNCMHTEKWDTLLIPLAFFVIRIKKGKGFPYSIPSVEPGADPGVQAVSPQVTVSHSPSGRLPLLSARPAVTSPASEHHHPLCWLVPSYTAWWQRHIGVNNLPKVVTQRHLEQDLN